MKCKTCCEEKPITSFAKINYSYIKKDGVERRRLHCMKCMNKLHNRKQFDKYYNRIKESNSDVYIKSLISLPNKNISDDMITLKRKINEIKRECKQNNNSFP